MICEVCNMKYEGDFCPQCGWEEELVLDNDYIEIYNKRKSIYKNVYEKSKQANNDFDIFMDEIIPIYNEYFKEYPKFIDAILEVLSKMDSFRAKNRYASFLLPKAYLNKDIELLKESFKITKSLQDKIDKKDYEERLKTIYNLATKFKDFKLAQDLNDELKGVE